MNSHMKSLLFLSLAAPFLVSCDGKDSETDARDAKSQNEVLAQAEKSKADAAEQAKKKMIEEKLVQCRARLKENPKAVFEWDNSIDIEDPQNSELVEQIILAHAMEWVMRAVDTNEKTPLNEETENWPFSQKYLKEKSIQVDDWDRLKESYLTAYSRWFNKSNLAEVGVDEKGERTLESIKNDKIQFEKFWDAMITKSQSQKDIELFDENGNAYETYKVSDVLGSFSQLSDFVENVEDKHYSREELQKYCLKKLSNEFSVPFNELVMDASNMSCPVWYKTDDVFRYINKDYNLGTWNITLADIKKIMNAGISGTDEEKLEAAFIAYLGETVGGYNVKAVFGYRWADVVQTMGKVQRVYMQKKLAENKGEAVKKLCKLFRADMPQCLLNGARELYQQRNESMWNNDFGCLLLEHTEYKHNDLLESDFPSSGAGVMPKSRVFQDICFGMDVEEFFRCKALNEVQMVKEYDINELKEKKSFTLEANVVLFGTPAKAGFIFHPALASVDGDDVCMMPKLCAIRYSIISSDDDLKKLEQARQKAKGAAAMSEADMHMAQGARAVGWDNAADKATAQMMNNLVDSLSAAAEMQKMYQDKQEIINLWIKGFASAKKPYRQILGTHYLEGDLYTNNPFVYQQENSSKWLHDEEKEKADPDINMLLRESTSVLIYPARYMSLSCRISEAQKILKERFVSQYDNYIKNGKIQENAADF